MEITITILAIVIICCILFNRIFCRIGMPTLLAFILLGMIFGVEGIFKINFDNYIITEQICKIALIFIMFYGGFGTNWKQAKPIINKSLSLSFAGVILTSLFVGCFCHLVLKISWIESFLIGSVISSTDAASVFSILRSKKMNLKHNTASLLEVESGSNDPCAYMLTLVFLSLLTNQEVNIFNLIFCQLFFGVLFGILIAYFSLFILKKFNFLTAGFDAAFVIAIALLSYTLPSIFQGNGYMSCYIVGIVLGNSKFENKKGLVYFFNGITGLTQMLIFFLLGLLVTPSNMIQNFWISLSIALFLTFIGRPLAVFLNLSLFKSKFNQQVFVSFAGIRGASSIVFAIVVLISGVTLKHNIFDMVFLICLFSIVFQGALMPQVAKYLKMIDPDQNVLKTFNDYSDEQPVDFIRISIKERSKWENKLIKELLLPPDSVLAMIIRDGKKIIPKGNTKLLKDDEIILAASSYDDNQGIHLYEIVVDFNHEWYGKKIKELNLKDNELIILIKRRKRIVIPNGDTILFKNDILVMNKFEE